MSYEQYRPTGFRVLPPVVKNLLIINGLFFLATISFGSVLKIDLTEVFGLHYFQSVAFRPHQLVTYMFMHGNFSHILFNMFALWMFGNVLENFWGPKRFLIYYMITGIGAGLIQLLVIYFQVYYAELNLTADQIAQVRETGSQIMQNNQNFVDPFMGKLNALYNMTTVGASGAVFGLLLAFGMLFPNTLIYIYFFIPMKAKWFVVIYGVIELFSGVYNTGSNVAHFAHLGGMLFGYFLIVYWKKYPHQN
ncbi:MAG: rhomboid family intramembrane serine protease [Bacteroidales bacterium]